MYGKKVSGDLIGGAGFRGESDAFRHSFGGRYAGDAGGVKAALEGEHSEMMSLIEEWWNEKMRERERVSFA